MFFASLWLVLAVTMWQLNFLSVSAGATGRVIVPKKGSSRSTRKKLTFPFLVKSFFVTMVDPTYHGNLHLESAEPLSSLKAKGGKGKRAKLGGAVFGEGGATIGGGSFGPVCGPNGCH